MMELKKYIKALGIKKPVDILLRDSDRKNYVALHSPEYSDKGNLRRHTIIIFMRALNHRNERDLDTILAHELIHAWQAENNKHDVHGRAFQSKARAMSKQFSLPHIFVPGVDLP